MPPKKANDERPDSIDAIVSELRKTYGVDTTFELDGSGPIASDVRLWVSTRIPTIDLALGHPGIPCGKLTEISGNESSGKTTLALSMAADVTQRGGTVWFFDTEHALNREWAEHIGVISSKCKVQQPSTLEDCLDQMIFLINRLTQLNDGHPHMVIWDSQSSTPSLAEVKATMSEHTVADAARLVSAGLRKMVEPLAKSDVALVIINQHREDIGAYGGWGTTYTFRAYHPQAFHSSLMLVVSKAGLLSRGEGADKVNYGSRVKVMVQKNKVAVPLKMGQFVIMFDEKNDRWGPDIPGSYLELAVKYELVRKRAGGFYEIDGRDSGFTDLQWYRQILGEFKVKEAIDGLLWSDHLSKGEMSALPAVSA